MGKFYNGLFWVWWGIAILNALFGNGIGFWSCLVISQIMIVLQVVTEAKEEILNKLKDNDLE